MLFVEHLLYARHPVTIQQGKCFCSLHLPGKETEAQRLRDFPGVKSYLVKE